MKMIIRTLCAAALVFGAVSLTGCGDKPADKTDTTKAQKTDAKKEGEKKIDEKKTEGEKKVEEKKEEKKN